MKNFKTLQNKFKKNFESNTALFLGLQLKLLCLTLQLYLQVDHTRVNEFGYSGEMLDEAAQKNAVEGNKEDENPPQKEIEAKKKD